MFCVMTVCIRSVQNGSNTVGLKNSTKPASVICWGEEVIMVISLIYKKKVSQERNVYTLCIYIDK